MHTAFQAQCIRLLYPSLIKTSNSIIISDMDVIPLSPKYFMDTVKSIDDNKFVYYRNAVLKRKMIAIANVAARPTTWKEIFQI